MDGCARFVGWLVALSLVLLGLTGSARAQALPAGVRFEPVPAWVKALDFQGIRAPEASGGVELLAVDTQAHIVRGQEARFVRALFRVTTELGAKALGEQRFVFTPPHQKLVLHKLEVRRSGLAISALRPAAVQLLQREARLESGVYDGELTAVVVVPDLRVGDEVLREYSVVGANPVAAGHWGLLFRFQSESAVGRWRIRLVADRELGIELHAGAKAPEVVRHGSTTEFEWQLHDVPAGLMEEETPPEAERGPWADVTDFRNWAEVAEWGRRLFQVPATLPKQLAALRSELEQSTDPHERALGTLRLVQERVRYLALAFAESSHRPAPPALVVERGFGDCKDKSLLAVTLLRSLGLEADVALVSSSAGDLLPALQPTISAFDHVIVTVVVDGVRRWIDPTRLYQRGTLSDVAARGFRYALRLGESVAELEEISEPNESRPNVKASLHYEVKAFGGAVELGVSTTYIHAAAEGVRAMRASLSQKDLRDQLGAPVLKIYPKALAGDPFVRDREIANEVTVTQMFQLDADDWARTKEGRQALSVFPVWLAGHFPVIPATRKNPIVLPNPYNVSHLIEVRTPNGFDVAENEEWVQTPGFDLALRVKPRKGMLTLAYDFTTKARRVRPSDFADYNRATSEAARLFDYSIIEPVEFVPQSRATLFACVLAWAVAMLGVLWYLHLREPYFPLHSVPFRPELAGRTGWLAFLGLGVVYSPLRMGFDLFSMLPSYSAEIWGSLVTPQSPAYHPAWAFLLGGTLLFTLTQVVLAAYCVFLYLAVRRSFPALYSLLLGLAMIATVFELWVSTAFEPLRASTEQAGSSSLRPSMTLLFGLVWIVYLFNSERVKATFLGKNNAEGELIGRPEPRSRAGFIPRE